jgi:hypothetical protein
VNGCEVSTKGWAIQTRFQAFARSALEREFGPIPLELRGEKENYLFGLFPPLNVELYIYENGCELRDAVLEFRAERWDYNGPEDLVADLVLRARAVRSAAI